MPQSEINKLEGSTSAQSFWSAITRAGEKTAMIHAGLELKVWAKIAAGYRTAKDFVKHEGWDITGTRTLLDALFAIDLLHKDETGYYLVPVAEQTLLPGSPNYVGDNLLMMWAALGHSQLADSVRSGKRPLIVDITSENQAAAWATLPGTVGFYSPDLIVPQSYWSEAESLWRVLGIEARDGLRLLDVGSGPGVLSMALARQHRGLQLTLIDRQPELDLAKAVAAKQGLSQQITMLPGDMLNLDYGKKSFDIVLFGFCLMFFGPEDNVNLLRKAYSALVSAGTVVVAQYIADDARYERKEALINGLWIYSSTSQGDAYSTSEIMNFMQQAGFVNQVELGIPGREKEVIRAQKQ